MTASPNHDRPAGAWIVAAAIFLLVAGIGTALSYMSDAPETRREGDTLSLLLSRSESNDEMLQRLTDYAGSPETGDHASVAPADKMLPDVNTMIERLANRLKTSPNDIEGWRMLGWSYFQTGRYQQAVTAYARAVELDPSSAEFKRAYEDAKAKAAESSNIETASSLPTETAGKGEDLRVDKVATSEATPPSEREAAIRSMVEDRSLILTRFRSGLRAWLSKGKVKHDTSHVTKLKNVRLRSPERKLGHAGGLD